MNPTRILLALAVSLVAHLGCGGETDIQCAAPGPVCDPGEMESTDPCTDDEAGTCRREEIEHCGEPWVQYCRSEATCPAGPSSPVNSDCGASETDLQCAYGYADDDCGGITVQCDGSTWMEVEHTDPGPNCNFGTCPDANPLGDPCDATDLQCDYGYADDDCGGITARCDGTTWFEVAHTDPGPDCDFGE